MKIGLSSWTFAWSIGVPGYPKPKKPLDFEGLLRRTKELNVHLLQVADNFPLDAFEKRKLEAWASKARKSGIEIEVGTSGASSRILLNYLELARIFNSRIVRTTIRAEEIDKGIEFVTQNINSVIREFEKEEIFLLIENYEQIRSDQLLKILDSVGSSYLGVCLDTTNSIGAVEPIEELVRKFLPYIMELHLKDYRVYRLDHKFGFIITGAPLGEGNLNIDWVLRTLASVKNDIHIILEQWVPFSGSLEETLQLEAEWIWKNLTYIMEKLKTLRNLRD